MTVRELMRELLDCKNFDAEITVMDIAGNGMNIDYVATASENPCIAVVSADDEPDYDCDWGYNEDMGYDPYMGCYTDDC